MTRPSRAEVLDWATEVSEDLDFGAARAWLSEREGRKAAGYLPVYVPKELLHAAGFLPVGLHGGGDRLEIIRGDAFYQSYICHLPRSVVELLQSGRLPPLSAVLFPSTCDVIRNLSGVFRLSLPGVYVKYLDLPQVEDPGLAARFWEGELRTLFRELCEVSGTAAGDGDLRRSIGVYNELRQLARELYRQRRETPERVPTEELARLLRACEVVPPETARARLTAYLAAVESGPPPRRRDQVRVIVVGAFCEQPPLLLLKTLERAGCAIVDDDLLLGNRMLQGDVPVDGDPLASLARALVTTSVKSSILYEPDPGGKRRLIPERAAAARAEGVIFAAPSFCDPALLDRPMLRAGCEAADLPSIAFQYAENTGQLQQFREQAGTFADSIKLWGSA